MPVQFIQDIYRFISKINKYLMNADQNRLNIQQKNVVQQVMEADQKSQQNIESLAFPKHNKDKLDNGTNRQVQMARAQLSILECIEGQKKLQITFDDIRKQLIAKYLGDQVIHIALEKFTSKSKVKRPFDARIFQLAQNHLGNIIVFITSVVRKVLMAILKKQKSLLPTLIFGSRKCGKTIACFTIQTLTQNLINIKVAGKIKKVSQNLPMKLSSYLKVPKIIIISVIQMERNIKKYVIRQCTQFKFSEKQQNLGLFQLFMNIQIKYREKQTSVLIILDDLTQYYQRIDQYFKQTVIDHKSFLLTRIRQMQKILCCVRDVFGHSLIVLLQQDAKLNIIQQSNEDIKFEDIIKDYRQNMVSQHLSLYDMLSQQEKIEELNRITMYQMMKMLEKSMKQMCVKLRQSIISQVYQQWKKILINDRPRWRFYSNYGYIKEGISRLALYWHIPVQQYLQNQRQADELNQSYSNKGFVDSLIKLLKENLDYFGKSGYEDQRKLMIKFTNQLNVENKRHHIRLMRQLRRIAEQYIGVNQSEHAVSYFDVKINRLCKHFMYGLERDKSEMFSTFNCIDFMKNQLFYQKFFIFDLNKLRIYIPPADFLNFTSYIDEIGKQQLQKRYKAMNGQQKGKQYESVAISIMTRQQDIWVQLGKEKIHILNPEITSFKHFYYTADINILINLEKALNNVNKVPYNTFIGCQPQSAGGGRSATSPSFDLLLICQKQPGKYLIKTIDFTINRSTNQLFVQSERIEKTKYGKANNLIKKITENSSNLFEQNNKVSFEWCHYIICPTITCEYVDLNKTSSTFTGPQEAIFFIPINDVKIQGIVDDSLSQAYAYFMKQYSINEDKQSSKKRKLRVNRFVSGDDLANSTSDKDKNMNSTPQKDERSRTHDKPKKSRRQKQSSPKDE